MVQGSSCHLASLGWLIVIYRTFIPGINQMEAEYGGSDTIWMLGLTFYGLGFVIGRNYIGDVVPEANVLGPYVEEHISSSN